MIPENFLKLSFEEGSPVAPFSHNRALRTTCFIDSVEKSLTKLNRKHYVAKRFIVFKFLMHIGRVQFLTGIYFQQHEACANYIFDFIDKAACIHL